MDRYSHIIMVGPGFDTRSGIATVARTYRDQGLFRRWPIRYVCSRSEGGALVRFGVLCRALVSVVCALLADRRAVVHLHGSAHAGLWPKTLFVALAAAFGCPFVFHLHGAGFRHFYESECGPAQRALVRFFLGRAERVVVLSERCRRWMESTGLFARVACIPSPVVDGPLVKTGGRGAMILFLGRLDLCRGVYDLIEALSALRLRIPEATLVCAGEGDPEPLAGFCERHGVADAVTFTGWIGEAQKRALMQRASVFVLPTHADAIPMSLLEAMAARLPVVASATGGIREVITDGADGLLYESGDVAALHRALCRLLHDPALGARIAAEGRRTAVARFSPDRVLAQLGALYAELGVARGVSEPCAQAAPGASRTLEESA
jgi:glycosyltransferase involved in cell wall biosynthesis